MKKHLLASTITLVLLLLVTTSFASAGLVVNKYTNDFSIDTDTASDVLACACETRAETLTITNTGNFYSKYHASITASEDWYELMLTDFTLSPGETRQVVVYANPPCGTIGNYEYSITIASSYGRERTITHDLVVNKCQNLYLHVTGGEAESNLCQPLTYNVTLKNVAEFPDTYTVDLGSFNEHAAYSTGTNEYYLGPGEEKTFGLTITPPCSLYGDVDIPFSVRSTKNTVTQKVEKHVRIENEFDHEIVTDTQLEICSRVDTPYAFGLQNLIDVPNEYTVLIDAPGFVDYDVRTVSLDGNQRKNISLVMHPKKGQEGVYNLRLKVASDLGDVTKTRDVELDVFDCFAFNLGYTHEDVKNDGTYSDTACCGVKEYTLNIRNDGQTTESYNLVVDGPSWFKLEERTITLQPSENRNVKVTATLPCTDETYEVGVTASLTRYPAINETVWFNINSQTQRTCHAVSLETSDVRLDEQGGVQPVILTHEGLQGGVYDVSVDGDLFQGLLEEKITLEPGEEKVLHLIPKANLTDFAEGRYVSGIILSYEALNITYREPFWTTYKEASGLVKFWRDIASYDYAAVTSCMWTVLLLSLLVIAALVTLLLFTFGKARRWRTRTFTKKGLAVLRALLIGLFVLSVVGLSFAPLPAKSDLYETPYHDSSGKLHQWYENEQYTIDLGLYFTDPDADWIEYTATQPAHISVHVKEGTAVLTPDHNWAGEDKIVITASDQKGGVTDSPIIALKVLHRKDLSFLQWVNRYCTIIALSLATTLFAFLLFLSFFTLKAKRDGAKEELLVRVIPPSKPRGRTAGKRSSKNVVRTVARKGVVTTAGAQPRRKRSTRTRKRTRTTTKKNAKKGERSTKKRASKKASRAIAIPVSQRSVKATTTQADYVATQPVVDKGATVNIAVGTAGGAASKSVVEPRELILIAAKDGSKVHDPQCVVAQRIPRKKRVVFTSKKEAARAGYAPCKLCQSFDRA